MKKTIGLFIALSASFFANAQSDTVVIKTSALCEQCKERIERDLSFEKGVKSGVLNLDTKELTVVYNAQKTDPAKIRLAITRVGYDADSLKADVKAFNRLPECCRVPGVHEMNQH
jgi:periplasmic mercuric ion binding protein